MAPVLVAQSPSGPVVKYIGRHHTERTETLDLGLTDQVGASQTEGLGKAFWTEAATQTKANNPEIYQTSWKALKRKGSLGRRTGADPAKCRLPHTGQPVAEGDEGASAGFHPKET